MARIAIVCSKFNGKITSLMLSGAKEYAGKMGAQVAAIVEVPGAYEIPFAASKLLARSDVEGVAAIGAVIRGETKHDEAITYAMAQQLLELSIKSGKPIGLGVIGPGATEAQAKERAKEYARRSIHAVLHMLKARY